jgi:GntR family transcriptional regulator
MRRMASRLDPESPVPLYHQIAEAIRYDVATGRLAPGAPLPPLREAARLWGVNLHTVRHAYKALAEGGVVTIRPPRGAVVAGAETARRRDGVDRFVERTLREAHERHGLSREQLVELLSGPRPRATPEVRVVECSETQSADLAAQIAARWDVHAVPWSLGQDRPLPDGDVVATLFHYNDVRRIAPARLDGVRFVTIRPDPALASRVARLAGSGRRPRVALVERDESMARSIAADVSVVLGATPDPVVVPEGADPFAAAGAARVVLFSPRMWGALTAAGRRDPRALEVRYLVDAADLEGLGAAFGWRDRAGTPEEQP